MIRRARCFQPQTSVHPLGCTLDAKENAGTHACGAGDGNESPGLGRAQAAAEDSPRGRGTLRERETQNLQREVAVFQTVRWSDPPENTGRAGKPEDQASESLLCHALLSVARRRQHSAFCWTEPAAGVPGKTHSAPRPPSAASPPNDSARLTTLNSNAMAFQHAALSK